MIRISRKFTGVQLILLAAILATAGFLYAHPDKSRAYSWSSASYYLKNYGSSHYAYRTTQFVWQNWSGNDVAIPQISFSARIPSVGWAYYGWNMMAYPAWTGGYTWQSSYQEEPGFAMDINNGWVSRVAYSFGDLYVPSGGQGAAYTFLCEVSTQCGNDTYPFWYGAMVAGAMYHNATSGFFLGAQY